MSVLIVPAVQRMMKRRVKQSNVEAMFPSSDKLWQSDWELLLKPEETVTWPAALSVTRKNSVTGNQEVNFNKQNIFSWAAFSKICFFLWCGLRVCWFTHVPYKGRVPDSIPGGLTIPSANFSGPVSDVKNKNMQVPAVLMWVKVLLNVLFVIINQDLTMIWTISTVAPRDKTLTNSKTHF